MLVVCWIEPQLLLNMILTSDSVTRAKSRLKGRLGISTQDDLDAFLKEF